MQRIGEVWRRLTLLFRRAQFQRELREEMDDHVRMKETDLTGDGVPPDEARNAARREFGNALLLREQSRDPWGFAWLETLLQDLRYGLRQLRGNPGFATVAVISLALAIGVNTTIFSLARQLLYERLNVSHAEDLRLLGWTETRGREVIPEMWGNWNDLPDGRVESNAFSYPVYEQLKAENHSLDDLFAFKDAEMNATIRGEAQRVRTEMVSGNYYEALVVRPALGRAIRPSDDDRPGQGAVAVISYGLWERDFGRSAAVVGQEIKLNDVPLTIVGVNPRGFTGAQSTLTSPDVFVPLAMQPLVASGRLFGAEQPSLLANMSLWWVSVMGRAKPGVSQSQAQAVLDAQLAAILRATMSVRPNEDIPRLELRDGSRGLFQQEHAYAKPITVLMMLAGLVLLMGCANIANLMLARGTKRQQEMSVRMALGAGRGRIVRQMLVESLTLAALGGTGGMLAGYFGSNAIPNLLKNAWERSDLHVHFNWMVFAFTAGITILTGVLFGLAPAFAAARAEVSRGLNETVQTATRRRKGIGGKALVGFQIALSTLLVIVAGLFLQTLAGLSAVNVGFRTDHLLLAAINPPATRYPAGQDVIFHQRLEEAFAAIPGVKSVSATAAPYIGGDLSIQNKSQTVYFDIVGNRFFETMGIPILAGRAFGPQDTRSSAKVVIINQSLARTLFPGQNPIGKFFRTGLYQLHGKNSTNTEPGIQIVGVCGDTHYSGLRGEPPPQFFVPYVQQVRVGGMTYAIRTSLAPNAIVPALRRATQAIDPDLPLVNVRTEEEQIDGDLQQVHLFVTLTSGFGLLALALAAVGIYGIMAYSVASRRNEIGIRLALGAQPGRVRGMILCESTLLAAAGIAVGMAAALALTRLIQSMLYGLRPYDPLTLSAGVGLLLAVAVAATWIPARRAASVQPMDALRHE